MRMDPSKTRAVIAKCKGRCMYCGEVTRPGNSTIDHVVPTSFGGRDTLKNLVLACATCNNIKGSLSATSELDIKDFELRIAFSKSRAKGIITVKQAERLIEQGFNLEIFPKPLWFISQRLDIETGLPCASAQ